jgi:hypothetical protein
MKAQNAASQIMLKPGRKVEIRNSKFEEDRAPGRALFWGGNPPGEVLPVNFPEIAASFRNAFRISSFEFRIYPLRWQEALWFSPRTDPDL